MTSYDEIEYSSLSLGCVFFVVKTEQAAAQPVDVTVISNDICRECNAALLLNQSVEFVNRHLSCASHKTKT